MRENIIQMSKVFQHGKTQLPSDIRKYLSIQDGDTVAYIQDKNGRIYLRKGGRLEKRVSRRDHDDTH